MASNKHKITRQSWIALAIPELKKEIPALCRFTEGGADSSDPSDRELILIISQLVLSLLLEEIEQNKTVERRC